MNYNDLLSNISSNDNIKVIHSNYNEDCFGSFQIAFLFRNKIDLEIINDRGIIEINIIHSVFGVIKEHIPFFFAVNYINGIQDQHEFAFNDINSAQEFLFNNVNILELIIERGLMSDILKGWSIYKKS